jgi:hypothetical protein
MRLALTHRPGQAAAITAGMAALVLVPEFYPCPRGY